MGASKDRFFKTQKPPALISGGRFL